MTDHIWPAMQSMKTWTEETFSVVAASFDTSPLSVVELTALAGANGRFHAMQWPRCSILWRSGCKLKSKSGHEIGRDLELLGERLRGPQVAARGKVAGCQDSFRLWAEEDRCRAAWAIAAVMSSVRWATLENKAYIVRFLAAGLVAPAPWGCLSTASAVLQLLSRERGYCNEVDALLRELGFGGLLAQLIQHPLGTIQGVTLQAISHACDLGCDPLGLSSTDAVPMVVLIAESGCSENQREALEAMHWLTESSADRLETAIPILVQLLSHPMEDVNEAAASALWSLMNSRQDSYAIKACSHGCVPKLIDHLAHDKCQRQTILFCLESVTVPLATRHIALQFGILPLLFKTLRHERDTTLQECILEMLLCYSSQLSQVLVQQRAAERRSNIAKLVAIVRGASTDNGSIARQVLEHVAEDPSLSRLIGQVGSLDWDEILRQRQHLRVLQVFLRMQGRDVASCQRKTVHSRVCLCGVSLWLLLPLLLRLLRFCPILAWCKLWLKPHKADWSNSSRAELGTASYVWLAVQPGRWAKNPCSARVCKTGGAPLYSALESMSWDPSNAVHCFGRIVKSKCHAFEETLVSNALNKRFL